MGRSLDNTDYKILEILQKRGRITNIDLSKEIGLSPAPTLERVKKLERENYILGYHGEVNLEKLGVTVKALIQVTLIHQKDTEIHRFIEAVSSISEVVECLQVTGDFDYHLKVYSKTISTLDRLITERISKIPQVAQIKSHIILNTVKHSYVSPLSKSS